MLFGKHLLLALPAAALAVGQVGCDDGESLLEPAPLEDTAALAVAPPVPVIAFADFLPTGGTSRMVRTGNGVNFKLTTAGLEPGNAYTLWIVIFNNTAGCADGTPDFTFCGPADVVNEAARPDMMYAAGHVVGGSGQATFSGRRSVGDASASANAPVGLPAFGLENPLGAEFHLVVHDHGPKDSAFLPDMIKSIDGGCTDAGVPVAGVASPWNDYAGPIGGAFGLRGSNTCGSVQFAVHTPTL